MFVPNRVNRRFFGAPCIIYNISFIIYYKTKNDRFEHFSNKQIPDAVAPISLFV